MTFLHLDLNTSLDLVPVLNTSLALAMISILDLDQMTFLDLDLSTSRDLVPVLNTSLALAMITILDMDQMTFLDLDLSTSLDLDLTSFLALVLNTTLALAPIINTILDLVLSIFFTLVLDQIKLPFQKFDCFTYYFLWFDNNVIIPCTAFALNNFSSNQ